MGISQNNSVALRQGGLTDQTPSDEPDDDGNGDGFPRLVERDLEFDISKC